MYASILIAVDLDQPDSWARALPTAVALVRCFSARLTLCSVVRDETAAFEAEWSAIGYREMLDVAEARLATLASTIADLEVGIEVATGTIHGGILEAADRVGADLIVLSSHRPGIADYLLGANATRVVRHATCSVLVVRDALAGAGQ
jgi:nucleotide-binding universal stress UspA family protein